MASEIAMSVPSIYCNECGASNTLQATHCFACSHILHPLLPSSPIQVKAAPTNSAIPISKSARVIGPLIPSTLLHSRYTILRQIGTGGFGAVYQAKDTLFGNCLVAIKEMNQNNLSQQELVEATAAFEHEAILLASLSHPNLPRIRAHFTEQGSSYVVMDFIAGDTLEDYLDKIVRRLPVEDALEIAIQLSTVLDYLHTQQPPIIFRDIKPTNIMRTVDNHVYLIDFGIARHFKPGQAKDTIPLGSKGYAAPEQYGKAQSTPQSDIYGLGATLHQLLTGDDPSLTPFHFVPVQIPHSPISAPLDDLLKQMTEMEMSKRPASMTIIKQKLQHLLTHQTAQNLSQSQQVSRVQLKRRNFLIGLVSAVAVCSSSSAITAFLFRRQNTLLPSSTHQLVGNTTVVRSSMPTPSFARVRTLNHPRYTYNGHTGTVTAVAWSPHGHYIASSGTLDSSVHVWDATTGTIILISMLSIDLTEKKLPSHQKVSALFPTNNQTVDTLAWSSDGTRIASALDNDSIHLWNIATGADSLFLSSQPGTTNALAWSPDGASIAGVSGNVSVQIRSAITGNLSFTYTGHTQAVLSLAWSPNGKYIASAGADSIVQVWDAMGYTLVTYRGHTTEVNAVSWSPDSKYIVSGGNDGLVQLWNATTGHLLFTYHGHTGPVKAVAWQPEAGMLPGQETHIASAGADTTVQVWSTGKTQITPSGQIMTLNDPILMYRGHSDQVTDITWSPNGQLIASSSEDGTVQIWQAM